MSRANVPAHPCVFENTGDLNTSAPDGEVVPPQGLHGMTGLTIREHAIIEMGKAILTGAVARGCPSYEWADTHMAVKCADLLIEAMAHPQPDRLGNLVRAVNALLPEVDSEIDQRKTSGEDYLTLQRLVDEVREALP